MKKDANVSCGDYFEGRRLYPEARAPFDLAECETCGFARFRQFSDWDEAQFRDAIYNDSYHLCDAPFEIERPTKLAAWLSGHIGARALLDFGGGEGKLAELLCAGGHSAASYDPYYGADAYPQKKFDIVTAFEVVEHVPDQEWLFAELRALAKPGGLIVFSTLLRPDSFLPDWWYASPRNGHASFHSSESLRRLLARAGLHLVSLSRELHGCSQDPANLQDFATWRVPPVNGRPSYVFETQWSAMRPVSPQL
ncbi:MAG: class I SAM-dependent methyltransferase [Pseudomonadota bacterium]